MSSFADNFWGEKNQGFYVLYHNMKNGQTSSKEFIDFLRESCTVEEQYSKLLIKLAKAASNSTQAGTFAPFWNILKALIDKLASLHMQLVHSWSDIIKDVVRYNEEQHKRHKTMKEQESGTLDAVQSIQHTTTALHKAREIYNTRCVEVEKLKRDNASPKDVEKAEGKLKKASDEYKSYVEKYANIRNDFEKKMTDSCLHFQELQEENICQMKDFTDTYAKAWENEQAVVGQVHKEFRVSCDDLSVQKLIQNVITTKGTGTTKPGPLHFIETDLSNLNRAMSPDPPDKRDSLSEKQKDSSGSPSPDLAGQPGPLSRSVKLRVSRTFTGLKLGTYSYEGFVKSKREKKKEAKKKKKKDEKDDDSIKSGPDNQDGSSTPSVDAEGFTIRPDGPIENNGDKASWGYSSDSMSDSDGEDSRRKIKVEIRPLSPNAVVNTVTVADIKASVEGLRLSPTISKRRSQTPIDKKMKRSHSESDYLDSNKPSLDLLNLDFVSASSASTPTGGNYELPSSISPQTEVNDASRTSFNDTSMNSVFSDSPTLPPDKPKPSSIGNHGEFPSRSSPGIVPMLPPGKPKLDQAIVLTNNSFHDLTPTMPEKTMKPEQSQSLPNQVSDTDNSVPKPLNSPVGSGYSLPGPPPRPVSRNKGVIPQVASLMSKSDSSGNMQFKTTSMPVGSSRGPSPLTIGMSDTIPLATAFTESINALFRGTDATKCVVKISGTLMMSFPAGIVKVFTENPSPALLSFRIKNSSRLEQLLANKELLSLDSSESSADSLVYTFDMPMLIDHLRQQGEQNKTASYFNIDILKYQVKALPGVESTPLPVCVYWKCEEDYTNFRLDYRYNETPISSSHALKNVTIIVVVDGGVTNMQSIPSGTWNAETNRAIWKIDDISDVSEGGSQGCIRAKFDLTNGPSKPTTTAIQFLCEGTTLSGVDFEQIGPGYRLSLSKKRFATGKYLADPDVTSAS